MNVLTLTPNRDGDKLVIEVSGRVDTNTAPQLESDVLSRLDGVKELTLDFGKVEYISSAGLRSLIIFQKKMTAGKGRLTVCHVSDLLMDIFKATGLTEFIEVT